MEGVQSARWGEEKGMQFAVANMAPQQCSIFTGRVASPKGSRRTGSPRVGMNRALGAAATHFLMTCPQQQG